MASKVQICNIALAKLGVDSITSLSDNTDQAKKCNLLYDDIAIEVMSEGVWSSTVSRVELARTTNTPVFGYSYEFQLPTNPRYLRVLSINEEDPGIYDYAIEGDKLLTNVSTMKIKYQGEITDTESYGVWLRRSIQYRLAAELAYPLTGDSRMAQGLMEQYMRSVADGLAADGLQGSSENSTSDDLNKVR